MPAGHVRSAAAALTTAALLAGGLLFAPPAYAAPVLAVTSTADGDANDACTDDSVTSTASPVTLRNAFCVASNLGGAQQISVPAGTYTLGADGALRLGTQPGADITVTGPASGEASIVGNGTTQLLSVDPEITGGVSVTLERLTFTGGRDAADGGGAIIAGSAEGIDRDELVIRDTVFRDNRSTAGSFAPGGAVQFMGGTLTIENSVFDRNTAGLAAGGAVYYESFGDPADQALNITDSVFTSNTVSAAAGLGNGGGALAFDAKGAAVSITGSTFLENQATTSDGSPALGGAVRQLSGPATITASTFTRNAAQGANAGAGAVEARTGALTAHYSRFSGNTGAAALRADATSAVDATRNWWSCTVAPVSAPCDRALIANGTAVPFLTLNVTASPTTVDSGATSQLTGSLLVDSAGAAVPAAKLTAFEGLTATWTPAGPAGSTVASASSAIAGGIVTGTFTAGSTAGAGGAALALDAASVTAPITVRAVPVFTSPAARDAIVGFPFSATVTATGDPTPTISHLSGDLPDGLSFSGGANGTATISGTPTLASAGTHAVVLRAQNGATKDQTFTITVGEVPSFNGPGSFTLPRGEAADVQIGTQGGADTIALATGSAAPAGLTFADLGGGAAEFTGTPTTAGVHTLHLVATNRFATTTTTFTFITTAPPAFTNADQASFLVGGGEQNFLLAIDAGYPVATGEPVLSGAPAWLSLDTSGVPQLVGTPPAGSGGEYEFTLSLTNATGTGTQDFTLSVREAPALSGPSSYSVAAGTAIDETIVFTGTPTPTVIAIDDTALPNGITASDLGGGKVRLSGTAAAADAGAYVLGIDVENVAGVTHQDIGLTIGVAPSITSPATATFEVGTAGALPIVVAPGYPVAGAVTIDGTVPAWLSLSGAAGAQQLVGTPPAGAGGTIEFALVVQNAYGTDRQEFRLVVNEAPVVTLDPADASVVAGHEVEFEAGADGFPAPSVQWERSGDDGASWQPVAGGTSATLTLTPGLADDGSRYRAVFTNAAGTATTAEARLAVGEGPAFAEQGDVTVLPGAVRTIEVTVSGHPSAAITASGLPAWLALVDHGDGTATLSGTPALGDTGSSTIELTATNAYGSDRLEFALTVTDEVALPSQLPATVDGTLDGVPAELRRGQTLTVSGEGFLPGARIALGVYSTLTPLGSAVADASGAFSAEVTIPATLPAGEHALAASGVGADGSARLLAAETTLVVPVPVPGDGDGGSTPGGLSHTGIDTLLPMLLAAGGILAGLALLVLLAVRRRRGA
ncbi:putative Ig domain-containing protein [Agromyces mediolanus]|uniref:putative Ig domain-containing protein n=1 Tax=Agromyces mediolanus TaxID=41986 RepID=UPI00383848CC